MTLGHYTFEPCTINNLAAVEVTSDNGCTLGTYYLPARCKGLEDFAVRFLDPFKVLTRAEDR